MQIPPLAGLATYAEAARIGYGIEENVQRLLRYAWIEKRAMEVGLYWLASTPEWEVKEALGLHMSLDAEPPPTSASASAKCATRSRAWTSARTRPSTVSSMSCWARRTPSKSWPGCTGCCKPALLAAYQLHYHTCSPVIDHPTRRMLQAISSLDEEEIDEWGLKAAGRGRR